VSLLKPFTVLSPLQPAPGAWFGAYPGPGNAHPAAYEAMAGRRLDVVARYEALDGTWPTIPDQALAAEGRYLCVDWSTRLGGGSHATWADIAAGRYDQQIAAQAQRLAAWGQPLFCSFASEFDGHVMAAASGPLTGYAGAYRRVQAVAGPVAPLIAWMWVPSGNNLSPALAAAYPGDDVVDWIGADPYDASLRKGSPTRTYEPFAEWVAAQTFGGRKPLAIVETGIARTASDAAAAAWIEQVPAALAALGYQMWLWFNSSGTLGDTSIRSGSLAAAALAKIGAEPFFNQSHA
jgi:hypothetical protein